MSYLLMGDHKSDTGLVTFFMVNKVVIIRIMRII